MHDASCKQSPARKRRWGRFWLLGGSGAGLLLVCWVGYQLNWIRERHNAKVGFGIGQMCLIEPDGTQKLVVDIPDAPWPLGWFGEPGRKFLMVPDSTSKEELKRILALFPEADPKIEFVAHEKIDPAFFR